MYKPLPKSLTIAPSKISGLGLVAVENIPAQVELGISHVKNEKFENGYIRTPLGGFFNHSENPNCDCYISGEYLRLKTIKPIKAGEELTCYYWLYKVN
tara:strand:- start:207 stop:500 length:294 start_codon:yes stop_codon:yes gene_type:complete